MAAQEKRSATDVASSTSDRVSETTSKIKDKVADLGQTAADTIDDNRESVAGGLESVASTLHEKAESLPGGDKISGLAHSAADKLTTTADYVRQRDVEGMIADVHEMVKKNPGPALVAAAVLGFLVARAFSIRD